MNYLVLFISGLIITSCTQGTPYEVKSPCVAMEGIVNESALLPCVRRPANMTHDFA